MTADWLEPVGLDGTYVRLEALSPDHAEDLWRAGQDDEVWRWMPVARQATVEAMRTVVADALAERAAGTRVTWAIVERATGRAAGTTSYLDVVPAHLRLEVGWTWLGRRWWRTPLNTEAKLLLLGRAFDALGARRVALKTDAENVRSQAAIERIGGVREGVLRAHMVRPDGSRRDTVYFSVLREEWPAVRERLADRLQRGEGGPQRPIRSR